MIDRHRKHESTDLADVLGFNFTDVAPAEGLPGADHAVRARYSDFGYLLVWAEPLGLPLYLARS